MGKAKGAHLVGSIKATSADEAMRTAATLLRGRLRRIPDGETGERDYWIGFQVGRLLKEKGVSLYDLGEEKDAALKKLAIANDAVIKARNLGYSEAAEQSYKIFAKLRDEGVIERNVKFQVSVPTPYAVAIAWGAAGQHDRWMREYKPALLEEIKTICTNIPSEDLSIQIDVAVEVGVLEGAFPADEPWNQFDVIAREIADTLLAVPDDVERGVHYCYGDYGHRHFAQPNDLRKVVDLANAVEARAKAHYLHFPADRTSAQHPQYFAPLNDLTNTSEISIGVIDYEGDSAVTDAIVAAVSSTLRREEFAVATECGLARIAERGESSLQKLLEEHVRISGEL